MGYFPEFWRRFESEGTPVYIRGDKPDWFVPNDSGDRILKDRALLDSGKPEVLRFLSRLPDDHSQPVAHPERNRVLQTDFLKEVWFHITDRCNLACNYCLFSSSPKANLEMSAERIYPLAQEAHELGCRVFALTGGEPFIHPGFGKLVSLLLGWKDTHVVVLTNGSRLTAEEAFLAGLDKDRFHLQISVDGIGSCHDRARGRGQFERLTTQLEFLKGNGWPFTVSMCVSQHNFSQMPEVVSFAAEHGGTNVHFMWYFIRGRGKEEGFVDPLKILPHFLLAQRRASELGVGIDNLDSVRSRVFAPSGTRHDGTNAGWESLAVGPDGKVYPTPATIGIESCGTPITTSLETAWRESPVLESVRSVSSIDQTSSFRFLLGGGDLDHSFVHAGTWMGDDPFTPLFERVVLWMIAEHARRRPAYEKPGLRLKMGDVLETCGAHGDIALTHSNCLLSAAQHTARASVMSFYTEAARSSKTDILNPVSYADSMVTHIPEEFRLRGYGCGSPISDAALESGDTVVDLGCGAGVECFVAAPMVGNIGRVIGVDMLDPMLERARRGKSAISQALGYDNLEFVKGFLEELPLPDSSADVVLSNCVLNLSSDKRATFSEILRILKPGGRVVVSDVVCDKSPNAGIKNDEALRGECIAGALTQRDLFGILEESGFVSAFAVRRFPYRVVGGHPFFSLTFIARRPIEVQGVRVMYRGPLSAVLTQRGKLLPAGEAVSVKLEPWECDDPSLFVLDSDGSVTNLEFGDSVCCGTGPNDVGNCCGPPDEKPTNAGGCCSPIEEAIPGSNRRHGGEAQPLIATGKPASRHQENCMVCGVDLVYLQRDREMECAFCGQRSAANAQCENGHFVCDRCHAGDTLDVLFHILRESHETDMLNLLNKIRQNPRFPIHGPEHHALVPGIILTTYGNLGGGGDDKLLRSAIDRGFKIPGGSCGFMGACGAAVGVGVAFASILESNPHEAKARQICMNVVGQILTRLSEFQAGRCCQRDSALSLQEAARLSRGVLPIALKAEENLGCTQMGINKECIFDECPFWPKRNRRSAN